MKAKDGQRPLDLIGFKNYTRQSSRETQERSILLQVLPSRGLVPEQWKFLIMQVRGRLLNPLTIYWDNIQGKLRQN